MLEFLGVAVLSATGWLISLGCSRSAARRHFVLCATLASCLLLPAVLILRAATGWTLLAIPGSSENGAQTDFPPPLYQRAGDRTEAPLERSGAVAAVPSDASAALLPGDVVNGNDELPPASSSPEPAGKIAASNDAAGLEQIARNTTGMPEWQATAYRWGRVAYGAVAVVLLLRIVANLMAVVRLKRLAVVIDTIAGDISVGEADVVVPLALGFGRWMIVLPRELRRSLNPIELRDVLAHEAAHLRRGDHWIMLLQELVAAAYWLIVTVHLVNRALSRAREELCDNAVLAGRDPASYGQTLLTVAERVATGRAFAPRLAPSVIWRGELERRVAGLLDDRRDRRTDVGRPVRWTVAIGLVALGALAVTTRVVAVADEPQQKQSAPAASDKPTPAQPAAIRWTGIPKVDRENPKLHRGVVLGPDGKPLAGASIYAASSIELLELATADKVNVKSLGSVRAVTDAEGRFEFNAEDLTWVTPAGVRSRWETLLVAIKEGLAPGWLKTFGDDRSLRSHWNPHPSTEIAVRTRKPATLTGRFLLRGGEPVVGARVRLMGLMAPFEYDLDTHIPKQEQKALGLFAGVDYAETLYRPWVLPGLTTEVTTDKQGGFEFPGLPEGFLAQIDITHPQAVTTSMRVAIRPIEPVYRPPFGDSGEPELTLYGSGFTAELEKGIVLRGQVVSSEWGPVKKALGVTVAQANHNDPEGMWGQRFTTDGDGRFEVTGLSNRPEGYELAFVGSFAAPWYGHRETIVPGKEARVQLMPAIPYRLKLTDPQGDPVDRKVSSIAVQQVPGTNYRDAKWTFNVPERVAPGVYRGIVPAGPAAVLVERRKSDRPVSINPKAFFTPGRTDWTLEEERYAYGDAWRIAGAGVSITDRLAVNGNPLYEQLDLAVAVLTNARPENGVLELTAVVHSDPPVEFTLVDEAGQPVEKARIARQLSRYNADCLPAKFSVYGLHLERAEFLMFRQEERGLIATLTTAWKGELVTVIMRPAATLRGQFVNKSGSLNFDFGARIICSEVMPDTYVAGRMFNITAKLGERNGEFELVVPPGVELRGDFVRKTSDWKTRPTVGTAFGPLTPKPGELVELGNIVVP
jgi:hypothetical protein